MKILQLLVNGVLLGSVYALVGLGMAMIFGIIGLTNLAHGEYVVLGAYLSTFFARIMGVDPILTLVVTVPFMFLMGVALQHFLINRAMKRGGEPALLVTFGLSIILQDAMLMIFSADAQHASTPYSTRTLHLAGLNIAFLDVMLFFICLACVLGLTLFLRTTYTGRAIRAISDDPTAAALVGINARRIYDIALGVALATAAVSGLCVGMKWTFYPSSGGQYLLIAFIVVVIGGMDSIPGTLLAGFGFGLAQVIGGANYGLLISYVVMLITLAIHPKKQIGK